MHGVGGMDTGSLASFLAPSYFFILFLVRGSFDCAGEVNGVSFWTDGMGGRLFQVIDGVVNG